MRNKKKQRKTNKKKERKKRKRKRKWEKTGIRRKEGSRKFQQPVTLIFSS